MAGIVSVRLVEKCLNNVLIKEYQVDKPVTEGLMHLLAADAKLSFFSTFPRPYFRIERKNAYILQGIIGDPTIRATLLPPSPSLSEQLFASFFQEIPPGPVLPDAFPKPLRLIEEE
jgi:hypothetical protein